MFTDLASTKSYSDSFFQVNEDVFKTPEASASDLKVTLAGEGAPLEPGTAETGKIVAWRPAACA